MSTSFKGSYPLNRTPPRHRVVAAMSAPPCIAASISGRAAGSVSRSDDISTEYSPEHRSNPSCIAPPNFGRFCSKVSTSRDSFASFAIISRHSGVVNFGCVTIMNWNEYSGDCSLTRRTVSSRESGSSVAGKTTETFFAGGCMRSKLYRVFAYFAKLRELAYFDYQSTIRNVIHFLYILYRSDLWRAGHSSRA